MYVPSEASVLVSREAERSQRTYSGGCGGVDCGMRVRGVSEGSGE